jgi:low temperature requirement protein LtrA
VRALAWKVALWAIALCYPAAAVCGRLTGWLMVVAAGDLPSKSQLDQAIRFDRAMAYLVGVLLWLIALIASMEATRAEGAFERRMGVTSLKVVLAATVLYVLAFFLLQVRNDALLPT